MFGRKPPGPGEPSAPPAERIAPTPFQPAKPAAAPAAGPRPAAPPGPRPVSDLDAPLPSRPAAPAQPQGPMSAAPAPQPPRRPAEPTREVRKLIVGKEITLNGEIAACDHLIVEGTVEASVKDCHRLEVLEAGLFRGSVEINEAEIAGRFEGQLSVQGRLIVRATGRVEGNIQYGELAVDAGGLLDGEIHGQGRKPAKAEKPVKPIAEAPLLDAAQPPSVVATGDSGG